jgi:hypothetical protein
LGGFEMFNSGVTDLGPSLSGWYGAPGILIPKPADGAAECDCAVEYGSSTYMYPVPVGIDETTKRPTVDKSKVEGRYMQCAGTCQGTTLFLVGDRFSVHETKVIAGGRCVPFSLLSRQIMQVTVPYNVNAMPYKSDGAVKRVVDVHVATPYGVSSHLLIPVVEPPQPPTAAAAAEPKPLFSWKAGAAVAKVCFDCNSIIEQFVFQDPFKAIVKSNASLPRDMLPLKVRVALQIKTAKGEPITETTVFEATRKPDASDYEMPDAAAQILKTLQAKKFSDKEPAIQLVAFLQFDPAATFCDCRVVDVGKCEVTLKLADPKCCPPAKPVASDTSTNERQASAARAQGGKSALRALPTSPSRPRTNRQRKSAEEGPEFLPGDPPPPEPVALPPGASRKPVARQRQGLAERTVLKL